MKHTHKLLSLHIVATIAIFFQIFLGNWQDWLITLIVYTVVAIGLTMTYHRYLAHRSFDFKYEWLRKVWITICTIGSGFSSPLAWVAIHREHHRFTDTDKDRHLGTKLKYLPGLHLKSMLIEPRLKYAVDIARDPWCNLMHTHYFKLHIIWAILLFIINPWLVISAYLVPVCLLWHSGNLVNSMSHLYGYKNFATKDQSKNNPVVALLFFGEWHNNHHAFPGSAKHGYKWWEIDITYYLIKIFGKNIRTINNDI
jgi:fatty-acid desaturase